jgi:hypothetical protein
MRSRALIKAAVVAILATLLLTQGVVWGQDPESPPASSTAIPAETEEKPSTRPMEEPGFVPPALTPDPYGILGLEPTGGPLAPYGNAAAYDTLLRGWRSHRLGKFLVTPYLAGDGLYRSNIFLTPVDKKSDFIFLISPGIKVELPIAGVHRLSVGYLGKSYIYTGFPSESHYDQDINADLNFNFRGGTRLRLGNTFRTATEERNSLFAQKRQYWRTTPYVTLSRAFADRWKLQGAYQFDTIQFANSRDKANNYLQQSLGGTLFYRFWPKTAVLFEYIFTYRDYPSYALGNNYTNSPLLGLTWSPTAKISGTVKFGYTFKTYENHLSGRNNTPENWILSAELLYRLSGYTNITVNAQRSFQEDLDFGNTGYRSSSVWVTVNHEWHYFRIFSYANFFYINNDYLNETFDPAGNFDTRLDNIIGCGIGFSRPITRWLKARVDYNYVNRNSNFFGYGYNENRVLFGLSSSF